VCTTELGYMAKIKSEFDKRGVKIIGLSVDPLDHHAGWAADIKETQGFAPNYPMIADVDYYVSKLYGMLPAPVSGDPTKRTPADNQTVRNVFVIGPDKKISLEKQPCVLWERAPAAARDMVVAEIRITTWFEVPRKQTILIDIKSR
jgi:alkyl hydroperoxide reductase subunit AhpC